MGIPIPTAALIIPGLSGVQINSAKILCLLTAPFNASQTDCQTDRQTVGNAISIVQRKWLLLILT